MTPSRRTRTRARRILFLFLLPAVGAAAGRLGAQEVSALAGGLSLDEAVQLAEANNPTFLASRNDLEVADWDVRSAWGALAPSASASSSVSWQGAGEQRIGSLTLGQLGFGNQPSYYFSSYNLGLSYDVSGRTLFAPRQAKANREATRSQVDAARMDLLTAVTRAYTEALRQREAVTLAEQQLQRDSFNLRLARGQQEVGTTTILDVRQAEVQVGRSNVALVQARAALKTARIRLLQQVGVPPRDSVTLTTRFQLSEPTWEENDLLDRAEAHNPVLAARRATADAASTQVKVARSAYLPSLSISAGISAFTREASSTASQIAQARSQVAAQVDQCAATNEIFRRLAEPLPPVDCSQYAFTDAMRRAIIDQNNQFPFDFVRQPAQASLSISLPIFQGLSRQRDVEAAQAQREDAVQNVRAQELAMEADVAANLSNVRASYQSAQLEAQNRDLAQEQLRLARERYQVGAITFVDLVDAETVLAQADQAYLAAVYAYHDAVTELESVVGEPLR